MCQEDLVPVAATEITGSLDLRPLLTYIGNFLPCLSSRRAKVCVRGRRGSSLPQVGFDIPALLRSPRGRSYASHSPTCWNRWLHSRKQSTLHVFQWASLIACGNSTEVQGWWLSSAGLQARAVQSLLMRTASNSCWVFSQGPRALSSPQGSRSRA